MNFQEYLLVKEILVRESIIQGKLSRVNAEQMIKLEKEKVVGIFDFLVMNDMIIQK